MVVNLDSLPFLAYFLASCADPTARSSCTEVLAQITGQLAGPRPVDTDVSRSHQKMRAGTAIARLVGGLRPRLGS